MNPQYDYPDPNDNYPMSPTYGDVEAKITNIVAQIDPQNAIDNLDHHLKGERWSKERNEWIKVSEPLANDSCRAHVISILSTILLNNSVMAHIEEKQLSFIMEGVFKEVKRSFIQNLEKFGFVPPNPESNPKLDIYYNKGRPDTDKMNQIAEEIYRTAFLTLTRALKGKESTLIFRSLKMMDSFNYGNEQPQKRGFLSKIFGLGR